MLRRCIRAFEDWRRNVAGRSFVHNAMLALVWLTFATNGLVFSEPAPTDALMLALIVLLPVVGLSRVTPLLAILLMLFAAIAASGLVAANFAEDTGKAVTHTLVTFFLAGGAFSIAGFVAIRPQANVKLIFNGFLTAAIIAAGTGLAGYFDLFPGAEIFTKFGRATGTFKDPNVFGPFLVPSILYALHKALNGSLKRILAPLGLAGLLSLAVLLSFSRGAWINLLVSLALYLWLNYVTASNKARRQKISFLSISAVALIAAGVAAILQNDRVLDLMQERASVTQDYDVGPEGRFGGQEKARLLILENPLGIGAAQFAPYHHHEEAHNVYLTVTMAAGWMGAGLYLAAVALTLLLGLRESFRTSEMQPFVLIALSVFAANVAEGLIIDSDHWRHFYVMMALIWGAAASRERLPKQIFLFHRPARIVIAA